MTPLAHRGRNARPLRPCAGVLIAATGLINHALAQQSAPLTDSAASPPAASAPLQEVTVTAQRLNLIGTATTASEGVVVNDELALTPDYRPGQLLETVPGLTVTSHSGEGKANQYMMRGYNLDHGTDLAVFVDGMPVNEPTHAHGQGYADLNFMIPELATNVTYTKGTYYADQGDFAAVGSVHVDYRDAIEDQVAATAGTLGFQRVLAAGSTPFASGDLLAAIEAQHYDGPWVNPDDQRKVNTVVRYSEGDSENGLSLTGMLYHGLWNSTTDQPERAIAQGLISRFGSLDPSDGGQAQRLSLSSEYHHQFGDRELRADAYAISNQLTLWNDFTHFLIDPLEGDQEAQRESRTTVGADVSYLVPVQFADRHSEVLVGVHSRLDANGLSRLPTEDRMLLSTAELAAVDYPSAYSEIDRVHLENLAAFVQATSYWNEWFRTVLGFREDYMHGADVGTNYGATSDSLPQPKVSLIITPVDTTELYLSWGRGFHSDDLRGVDQARIEHLAGAPLIASQTGEELGIRE